MSKPKYAFTTQQVRNWLVESTGLAEETGDSVWREFEFDEFFPKLVDLLQTHGDYVIGTHKEHKKDEGEHEEGYISGWNYCVAIQRQRNGRNPDHFNVGVELAEPLQEKLKDLTNKSNQ